MPNYSTSRGMDITYFVSRHMIKSSRVKNSTGLPCSDNDIVLTKTSIFVVLTDDVVN